MNKKKRGGGCFSFGSVKARVWYPSIIKPLIKYYFALRRPSAFQKSTIKRASKKKKKKKNLFADLKGTEQHTYEDKWLAAWLVPLLQDQCDTKISSDTCWIQMTSGGLGFMAENSVRAGILNPDAILACGGIYGRSGERGDQFGFGLKPFSHHHLGPMLCSRSWTLVLL